MWLHSQGVTGLGEDLKQLIVGEEVEAREEEPLGLQVVLQALLDLLQEGVIGLEGFQQACTGGGGGSVMLFMSHINTRHIAQSDLLTSCPMQIGKRFAIWN